MIVLLLLISGIMENVELLGILLTEMIGFFIFEAMFSTS